MTKEEWSKVKVGDIITGEDGPYRLIRLVSDFSNNPDAVNTFSGVNLYTNKISLCYAYSYWSLMESSPSIRIDNYLERRLDIEL